MLRFGWNQIIKAKRLAALMQQAPEAIEAITPWRLCRDIGVRARFGDALIAGQASTGRIGIRPQNHCACGGLEKIFITAEDMKSTTAAEQRRTSIIDGVADLGSDPNSAR